MIADDIGDKRSRAANALSALVEHLMSLLACVDLLAAEGHDAAAREVRRSLMRATTCLHALREELVTIEIVENYLRTYAAGDSEPS